MKKTYLELLKKIDTSIFQNYKIVDEEEIPIEHFELENCIKNEIPVKIEMLVDFNYYELLNYNKEKLTEIDGGWFWEFYSFEEGEELYRLLSEIGINDSFWKSWLIQSWGQPDYEQIWDGEEILIEDYLDSIDDAKIYKSVWKIKGTIEIKLDSFVSEK